MGEVNISSIVEHLRKHGYEADCSSNTILTNHCVNGKCYQIEGTFENNFPFELPKLYLLDRRSFGSIAHVGWDNKYNKGIICEGVSVNRHIDFSRPEIVYLKALEKAVATVNTGLESEESNANEIEKEFTAHWKFATENDNTSIISFVEPSDKIKLIENFTKNNTTFFTDSSTNIINDKYGYKKENRNKSQTIGKAFYFPINQNVLPPNPNTVIIEWWKNVLTILPELQKNQLKDIARKNKAKTIWILGSINIGDGQHGWFCIKFQSKVKLNAPFDNDQDLYLWSVTPFYVKLHYKEYLKPRGGATVNSNHKITIVGCGSVGAEIARQLVCSGIDNLDLVDYDELTTDNIYRHYLSSQHIGSLKSSALAHDLAIKYPYVNIQASNKRKYLKDCLDAGYLNSVTGFIVATGSPTDERFFNEKLFNLEKKPWVVYVWVEGYGVGGHSIYVHSKGNGCLNCLYRDRYGNKSLEAIQNFLKAEQEIAIDLSGCGSHFLPYSCIDSIQTAILGARLALLAMNNELDHSCRISWKSSNNKSLTLETSYRYNNFNNNLIVENFSWDGCDVCNPKIK